MVNHATFPCVPGMSPASDSHVILCQHHAHEPPVSCSLCTASLAKADERRRVFSEYTRSVLPLLMHVVTENYGRDVLRQVFTPGAKLCRPCLRRLERTTKLRQKTVAQTFATSRRKCNKHVVSSQKAKSCFERRFWYPSFAVANEIASPISSSENVTRKRDMSYDLYNSAI